MSTSTTQRVFLDDGNPDGTGYSKNPISNPKQAPVPDYGNGQIVTYQQTVTPATVATLTCAEKSMTIGVTSQGGVLAADFVLAVNKPTTATGLGLMSSRVSAANTVYQNFINTSGATITPTNETYNVTVIRGAIINSQALTPAKISAASTSEQIFNVTPTAAVITLTVNANDGGIDTAVVASGGAGYYHEPKFIITDPDSNGVEQGGVGAVLRAGVNTSGVVTQVSILARGAGYVTPKATAVGGNVIAKGMFPFVNKPTTDAGCGICNVRIPANNQIAITYVNPTAADVTPTAAETYKILALGSVPPISNINNYGVIATSMATVASITSSESSLGCTGLIATDTVINVQKPALQAGLLIGQQRAAANAVYVGAVNATTQTITPTTTEIYSVTVLTQLPVMPFKIIRALLTPVSVAANTTAEQAFTVAGLTYTNSSPATVCISKPSHQVGLAPAGARISATDTMYINYANVTAAAITPVSETYDIGCFNVPGPGASNWVAVSFSQSLQRTMEKVNDQGDTLQVLSMQKGA